MAYGYRPRRFFRRGKTSNPKKTKTVNRNKAVSQARRSNFNKRVLAVVNRASETKLKTISVANNHQIYGQGLLSTTQNQGTGHSGYIVPNLPELMAIGQGSEQEQRVGNKIRNCKLTLSGCLKSLPYDTTLNPFISPFEVHMVVYKSKPDDEGNPLQLKVKENNTVGTIDGTLENTLYPYNRDKYTIHKVRVFKLRGHRAQESLNSQETIYQVGGQSGYLKAFARFRCDIPINHTLMYQDSNSKPTNSWATVAFYVVDCMNNTILSSHRRASIYLNAKLTYKDD